MILITIMLIKRFLQKEDETKSNQNFTKQKNNQL